MGISASARAGRRPNWRSLGTTQSAAEPRAGAHTVYAPAKWKKFYFFGADSFAGVPCGSVNRRDVNTMLAFAVEGVPAGTDHGARDR
jgi:hypothetical protein